MLLRDNERVAPRHCHFPRHGIAVLFCMRAGSQSVRRLYEQLNGVPCKDEDIRDMERLLAIKQHGATLVQFVRDPVARFLSAYARIRRTAALVAGGEYMATSRPVWNYIIRGPVTLAGFLAASVNEFPDEKHVAPQHGTHGGLADFVWPLEDSARGWAQVQELASAPLPPLPRINVGRGDRPIGETFTAADWALFERVYSEDLTWYADVCRNAQFQPARSAAGDIR